MSEPSLLQRLKERKLFQWAVAYLCGAWVLVEATNLVVEQFSWPQVAGQVVTILAFSGFFVVLVIAWYHGEKGRQWVSGPELLIIALLLLISGGVLSMLGEGGEASAPAVDSDPVATEDERPGVAVLPCANMSAGPADGYLATSLHDEILLKLQKISGLASIGRTSVLRYADTPPATSVIASELGVGFIGECSVQKYGDQIRLIFQLLDGRTGSHVWAGDFNRLLNAENLFDIQSDIAQQIAHAVGVELTEDEQTRNEDPHTESLEAYEAYMRGRYHFNRRDDPAESFPEAVRYFQTAIELDPELAEAHAALAGAYALMAAWGLGDPREIGPQAERWARSALAIDSTVAEAHLWLAGRRWISDWNWEEAEKGFQRASELSPNDPWVHRAYMELLLGQGRIEEGLLEMRIATALDPLSSPTLQSQARAVFFSRRYEGASDLVEILLTRDPENWSAAWAFALSSLFGGHPEQVERLLPDRFGDSAEMSPSLQAHHAVVLSLVGEADRAKEQIEGALSRWEGEFFDPRPLWQAYAALGEKDGAFFWMERSVEVHSTHIAFLGVTPFADGLRDDPRYQALLDRIGLGHLKERFDSLAAAAGKSSR
jgi:TolB-like protein/Tfp pilus assembly protein PilF